MQRSPILVLAFFLFLKTTAQKPDLAWTNYDVSGKLDVKKFSALTKRELEFEKISPGFINARARLTLTDSGHRISPTELRTPDYPIVCYCQLKNDTIHITAALGLMSGLGITITIDKYHFAATFFGEADNSKVFKLKKSDSSYADRISVSAEKQTLTLLKKPSFAGNETIIGEFEGRFNKFYELDLGTQVKRNYKAKLFFKCRLP